MFGLALLNIIIQNYYLSYPSKLWYSLIILARHDSLLGYCFSLYIMKFG